MSGLYPNAVGADDFSINDSVMHHVNSKEINKHVGRVVDIDKKANRVWVLFPVGPKESLDPSELIIATPAMGECLVPEVSLNDSSRISKLAESVVATHINLSSDSYRSQKMATNVAANFVEKLYK